MKKIRRHAFRKEYRNAKNNGDWHTFDWDSHIKNLRMRYLSNLK